MRQAYRPPVQGGFGQFVDSIVLLVLVGLSLLAPLLFGSGESEAAKAPEAPPTWESLEQNPTMQAQWQKLGYDAEKSRANTMKIFDTIWEIADRAAKTGAPTYRIADMLVEEKLAAVSRARIPAAKPAK